MSNLNQTSTSLTLLGRLRNVHDQAAWTEFDARYRELIIAFSVRRGVSRVDAEDIAQQLMHNLTQALAKFEYDAKRGKFRAYLFRCVRNAISNLVARPDRRARPLHTIIAESVADDGTADDPSESAAWEEEWVAHHYRMAMETLRLTFEPQSVSVFERLVAGSTTAQIANEFKLGEEAIHKIRQRVRARLQEIIAEQVRDEDAL